MNNTDLLVIAAAGFIGYVLYLKRKKDVAEALNQNIDEKKTLVSLDQQKETDHGQAERQAIEAYVREKEKEQLSDEDLKNFFNNLPDSNPDHGNAD